MVVASDGEIEAGFSIDSIGSAQARREIGLAIESAVFIAQTGISGNTLARAESPLAKSGAEAFGGGEVGVYEFGWSDQIEYFRGGAPVLAIESIERVEAVLD